MPRSTTSASRLINDLKANEKVADLALQSQLPDGLLASVKNKANGLFFDLVREFGTPKPKTKTLLILFLELGELLTTPIGNVCWKQRLDVVMHELSPGESPVGVREPVTELLDLACASKDPSVCERDQRKSQSHLKKEIEEHLKANNHRVLGNEVNYLAQKFASPSDADEKVNETTARFIQSCTGRELHAGHPQMPEASLLASKLGGAPVGHLPTAPIGPTNVAAIADGTIKDSQIYLRSRSFKLTPQLRDLLSYIISNPGASEEKVYKHMGWQGIGHMHKRLNDLRLRLEKELKKEAFRLNIKSVETCLTCTFQIK